MIELIIQITIGLIFIIIGIFNMKGNISLLHSYHRKRVKKEDILPFGKKVGTGIILIGSTIIVAGIFELLLKDSFQCITNMILIIGFISGFIFIFYAMFKYNKCN